MSHQSRLQQWLSPGNDVTLAKIGILVCLLLLGLRLFASQVLLLIIPVAAGLACVLYLISQNQRATAFESPVLPRSVVGYLPTVVFVGLAALVLVVFFAGRRTVPAYLLTGAIGAVILSQILAIDETDLAPGLILAQILVAAVVIRMSALFVTPGFIGVDVWTHIPVFIDGIVQEGSLSAISDSKYIMAPLYHTLGAIGALAFGSARIGVYLSIGLLIPLSALFVYATGKLFVPVRWALLATTLYTFSDQFIRWSLNIIPTSLGLVFFLGVLYCVTKLFYTFDWRVIGLLLVFSFATVFTHQVATTIVLTFLGLAAFAVVAMRLRGRQTEQASTGSVVALVGTFLVTLVVTVASWANTPWISEEPFLWQILAIFQATLTGEAGFLNLAGGNGGGGNGGGGGAAESAGLLAEFLPFLNWFGFAILLLATVVGGLAMLRLKSPSDLTLTYLAATAAMFVVVFGFSLFGVRVILPGRWMAFMYALLAIISVIGLHYLSQHASRRVLLVVLVVVAVGYPMTMVVAETATQDSPAFEEEYPRFSYTESEIAAVETISTIYPPNDARRIDTDHPYQTLFGRLAGFSSETAEFDDIGSTSSAPVVSREYQTHGAAIFYEAGDPAWTTSSMNVDHERVCSPHRNHVYTNDAVKMCSSAAEEPEVSQ